jgi:hypothetical protein
VKTRTLRNVGISLVVVLVGAIGYLQWGGGEENAVNAGNHAAASAAPMPASKANEGIASGGAGAMVFHAAAAREDSPSGNAPAIRKSGIGTASVPAKESRALTPEEKEKVAAAMTTFQNTLQKISRGNGIFMVSDASTNSNAIVTSGRMVDSVKSAFGAPKLLEGNTVRRTFSVAQGSSEKPAVLTVSGAVSGDVLESTTAFRSLVVSQSSSDKSEAEQIAAASKGLSEVLQQFEAGSPAWKEARRQGEEMMGKMNTLGKSQTLFLNANLEDHVKIFDSRDGTLIAPGNGLEIQIQPDARKPAGK